MIFNIQKYFHPFRPIIDSYYELQIIWKYSLGHIFILSHSYENHSISFTLSFNSIPKYFTYIAFYVFFATKIYENDSLSEKIRDQFPRPYNNNWTEIIGAHCQS